MGKIEKSLILYVSAFTLLAIILSVITASLCDSTVQRIRTSYPMSGEKYYLTNEQGEQLGDGACISEMPAPLTSQDARIIDILELLPLIMVPLYSAFCIIAASFFFYHGKLKKPLTALYTASEKIADNDLDFTVGYDSTDELGQLCTSFETMRGRLADNFSEMWRQVEERKRLNAAFAHDLRTPLTVLKGYNEILLTSDDTLTRKTAVTMEKHISRMEAYINSMNSLQRLEDAQPEYKTVLLQPFLASLYENAKILCDRQEKILCLQNNISADSLIIDIEFISQVFENLVENAIRYARSTVTLVYSLHNDCLFLSVSDDGSGFSEKMLHEAASPYCTEESDHATHFGLGLYICGMLCERHGGSLQIENTETGGKVTASFKSSAISSSL